MAELITVIAAYLIFLFFAWVEKSVREYGWAQTLAVIFLTACIIYYLWKYGT